MDAASEILKNLDIFACLFEPIPFHHNNQLINYLSFVNVLIINDLMLRNKIKIINSAKLIFIYLNK